MVIKINFLYPYTLLWLGITEQDDVGVRMCEWKAEQQLAAQEQEMWCAGLATIWPTVVQCLAGRQSKVSIATV